MKQILGVAVLVIVSSFHSFGHLRQAADSKPKRDDATVEKIVAASLEADNKRDWKAYVELIHPESLQDYKNMLLPVLQAAAKEGPDKQADLLLYLGKSTDLKSLINLEPKEFFVTSMKGVTSQLPVPQESSASNDSKIIGTVREGDDLAYVVVRTGAKNQLADFAKAEVITLKRSGTEWKILLPEVVRVMAETFRVMFSVKPDK